jgi:hypothetical protein
VYLTKYDRTLKTPIFYDNLLRYQGSVTVCDAHGVDFLWKQVYYSDSERKEIEHSLKQMYSILHSDGSDALLPYLNIDSIDYGTFGNSKPFRIKVRNILNGNYIFLYIKKAMRVGFTVSS